GPRILHTWQVVLRRYRQIHFVLHVFDDPDDLHPRSFLHWTIKANALADRALARPVFARESLIDDHNRRRARFVLLGKAAALNDRNAYRAEIFRRADVITSFVLLARRGFWRAFDQIRVG